MAKMKILSYEEINKKRKNVRTALLLIALPIIVIISLFAFKSYQMYLNAQVSIDSFSDKNYSSSEKSAQKQKENNFFEPWLAYYNLGTTYAADKQYEKAEKELVKALELTATNLKQCYVRSNLALVYEAEGDIAAEQGEVDASKQRYALSLKVIEEAPKECFPPSSGGAGASDAPTTEAGKELTETGERVEGKQNPESADDPADGEGEEEQPAEPEKSDTDKIQDQMDQTNKDRTNKDNSERGDGEGEQAPEPDKPW